MARTTLYPVPRPPQQERLLGSRFYLPTAVTSGVVHRAFDGSGFLESGTNVNDLTGAFTAAAVIRQTTSGTTPFVWNHVTSGYASRVNMSLSAAGLLTVAAAGTTRVAPTLSLVQADGWGIVAVTTAAGTATPRFHVYKGGSWSHENASGTVNDALTHSGGRVLFGTSVAVDYQFDLAVAGEWNSALSDGDIEALDWASQNWADLSPLSLWNFDQTVTTDTIPDLVGAVDVTGVAGVPISTDGPAAWDYDVVAVHERSASFEATAAVTSAPQRVLQRSTSLGATGAVTSSGTVISSGATATLTTTLSNSLAGPTYTTDSFNPTVGNLIVVIAAIAATDDDAGTCTESAGGGTYTKIDHAVNVHGRIYTFVRDSLTAATTARTISVDVSGGATQGTGVFIWVVEISGLTRSGLSAIKQSVTDNSQSGGGTPNPAFGNSVTSGNLVLGAIFNQTNPATLTIPSGFDAELSDIGGLNPTRGGHLVKDDTGFTSTTVTWGSTSATSYCGVILELDTSAAGGVTVSRSASLSATGAIASAPQRRLHRQTALSATGAITSSATFYSILSGSAALSATATITSAPQRRLHRQAALGATAAIASSATFYSILTRSAALTATAQIAAAPQRRLHRQAALTASGSITSTAVFYSILERQEALTALATLSASGERAAATHSRSASLTAAGSIAAAGQRALLRSASFGASTTLQAAPQRALSRQASLAASASIATTGEVESGIERSASFTATAGISASPQRVLSRRASVTAIASIVTSRLRIHNRSVALSASASIAVSGHIAAIFTRSSSILAVAEISASGSVFGPGPAEETHPALGGVFDQTVTGGIVAVSVNGGTVAESSRGGTVAEPSRSATTPALRSGVVLEPSRGGEPDGDQSGDFDELLTGGRVAEYIRNGLIANGRGAVLNEPTRGGVLTLARSGTPSEPKRGGTFDESLTNGEVL